MWHPLDRLAEAVHVYKTRAAASRTPETALDHLDRAARRVPPTPALLAYRALLLTLADRHDEARQARERAQAAVAGSASADHVYIRLQIQTTDSYLAGDIFAADEAWTTARELKCSRFVKRLLPLLDRPSRMEATLFVTYHSPDGADPLALLDEDGYCWMRAVRARERGTPRDALAEIERSCDSSELTPARKAYTATILLELDRLAEADALLAAAATALEGGTDPNRLYLRLYSTLYRPLAVPDRAAELWDEAAALACSPILRDLLPFGERPGEQGRDEPESRLRVSLSSGAPNPHYVVAPAILSWTTGAL